MRRLSLALGLLALALLSGTPPSARAGNWAPDLRFSTAFHGPGFNDFVACAGTYENRLVIGGSFGQFNGDLLGRVATWDDPNWASLHAPFDGLPSVIYQSGSRLYVGVGQTGLLGIYDGAAWTMASLPQGTYTAAFQEYNGALHAGGSNLLPGSRSTAIWNGSAYQSPGSTLPGTVNAFTLYGSDLIAVGSFGAEAGNGISGVGRYNGTAWSSVGGGLLFEGSAPDVRGAVVFGGDLIVGGRLSSAGATALHNVARWDGSAWSDMGVGLSPVADTYPLKLVVWQNELYASLGYLSFVNSGPNVVKWNGSAWVPAGTGYPFGTYQWTYDLRAFDGQLYAVGKGGVSVFDGVGWSTVGHPQAGGSLDNVVLCLALFRGDLIAGGRFQQAGGTPANHLARWDGNQWHALAGGRTTPLALAVHADRLYAAGSFGAVSRIGVWDGVAWTELDAGPAYGVIKAMTSYNGELVVGGQFSSIGGVAASNVAAWDGTQWHALAEGVAGCDTPYQVTVNALTVVAGTLYVGGTFTQAGPWTVNHVARWNGTTWLRMGVNGGVTEPCQIQWLSDVIGPAGVYSIGAYGTGVAIGGGFGHINNMVSPMAGAWNGTWSLLGGNLLWNNWTNAVYGVTQYNGNLYAAGNLVSPENSPPNASAFSKWNGSSWLPVGITGTGAATAMVSDGNFIYVAGYFTNAGGISSVRMAAYTELPLSAAPEPGDGGRPGLPTLSARPNPFRESVRLRFALPAPGSAQIDILDVTGRRVRSLNAGVRDMGAQELDWDGRDAAGAEAPSGIYFLRLRSGSGSRVQRVVRLK